MTLTAGSRVAPTGTNDCTNGPCTGALTGSSSLTWTGGAATDAAVRYGEVGQITLKADLASASYLGSGLTATGTSGTVGSFVPAYFDTTVTPGCGSFTYSKQPFTVKAVAKNALGATTVNFSAGLMTGASACSVCSTAVTLGDPTGTTNFNGTNTIPATAFLKGEATSTTVAYTLPTTTTAPSTITLRGSASGVSATGVNEGTTQVRSGRVRVGNAFGSALLPLSLSLQSEYFKNVTEQWVPNSADNCSKTIPVPTVANNGLVFGTPTARNQLSSGEVVADIGGVTSGSVALPFSSGIAAIKLRSPTSATLGPGLSNFGFVDMDFGASGFGWLTWLPSATSNAKGRAEFGLYKGSNRYIFKQEVR